MLLSLRRLGFFESNVVSRAGASIALMAARLAEIRQAVQGRRAIARMDARMLSDIGLSRAEAMREINRKPWDTKAIPRRCR